MLFNKNTRKGITEEKIANNKVFILSSILLSFLINIIAIIAIASGNLSFKYIIFPILICIVDAVFAFATLLSNFRFSYTALYTTIYSGLFIATTLIYVLVLLNPGKGTAITLIALILWIAAAVLSIIAVTLGAASAGRHSGAIGAMISLAVLGVCICASTYSMISSGFFGQGKASLERPVTFVYDSEAEYYVANGVLEGKGKTAVVPATFNGIKVGAVDCSLFLSEGLTSVSLMTDFDVDFVNSDALLTGVPEVEILASKATISDYAKSIYSLVSQTNEKDEQLCALASRLVPSDLSAGEIYVTFSYSPESVLCASGEFLPIWIGHRNDVFSFDYANDVNYIVHSDINDESNLSKLYKSGAFRGGNVLSTVMHPSGGALVGATLTGSVPNVNISFEKIYCLSVGNDNDAIYEIEDSFKYLDKVTDRCRYVTKTTADALMAQVVKRNGFTLSWSTNGFSSSTTFQKLSEVLGTEPSVAITPTWTLNPPTISSFASLNGGTAYTYGDAFGISATTSKPIEESTLTYEWYKDGKLMSGVSGTDYSIDKLRMTDAGSYELRVTAKASTVTSLTSSAKLQLNISVAKKLLPVTWNGFDGTDSFTKVYSASDSIIGITYDTNAVAFPDDVISYSFSASTIKNAGNHTITLNLTGDCASKYSASTTSQAYTIEKKEIEISWLANSCVYNAGEQAPAVTIASGTFIGDDVSVSSASKGVNVGSYKATASLIGSAKDNYSIKTGQKEHAFTIIPATISIDWSGASQTYQAKDLKPTATAVGLQGSDAQKSLNLSIPSKKAAGTYSITATINNANYVLDASATMEFEILPAPLTLEFGQKTVTYNATVQKPTYTVKSGLCAGDTLNGLGLALEGKRDAGVYTVTVTVANTNYTILNPTINDFEIKKATLTVIWESDTALVYNGTSQHLGIKGLSGIYAADQQNAEETITASVNTSISAYKNVGSAYTAYAVLNDTTGNYVLADKSTSVTFSIVAAPLTLSWGELEFIYDKTTKIPTAVFQTLPFAGDTTVIEITGGKVDAGSGYKATASINNTNYYLTNPEVQFKILPKEIAVTWTNDSFTYDGVAHAPTASFNASLLCEGDSAVIINVSGARTAAGAGTASASFSSANYKPTSATATKSFSVERRAITITWGSTELTYNGQNQAPTASIVSGLIAGDSVSFTYNGMQKNVGTGYTATAVSANPNYYINGNAGVTFSIKPAEITISWNDRSLVYNGREQHPVASVSSGKFGSDNVSLTYVGSAKNVGDGYTVSATSANANYTVVNPDAEFSIMSKTVSVRWSNLTQTYNGSYLKPGCELVGVAVGDNVEFTVFVKGESSGQRDVGIYTVTVTINDPNYTLENATATFTIVPAPATNN